MILAANFKMNHTRKSTHRYLEHLSNFLFHSRCKHDVFVFPPAIALDSFEDIGSLIVGAQNAYPAPSGAFTGEIGSDQLEELGIKTLLIGHSERRNLLGESQEFISAKFRYYAERDYTIFYCIGEDLEIRRTGIEATIRHNLSQLHGIDLAYPKLIVAYEPIWAIGTGLSASLEEIKETHARLKEHLPCPLLYGGSVNLSNIAPISELPEVDGVLIGSAALEAKAFAEMIRKIQI